MAQRTRYDNESFVHNATLGRNETYPTQNRNIIRRSFSVALITTLCKVLFTRSTAVQHKCGTMLVRKVAKVTHFPDLLLQNKREINKIADRL